MSEETEMAKMPTIEFDVRFDDFDGEGEKFVLKCEPAPVRRGHPVDPEARRYNEALWRLVRGDYDIGGVCHELAIITGLSPETIRGRVDSIEYEPAPLEPGTGLTSADMKYLGKHYKNSRDPEVREFFQGISGGQRRRPDHENPRVRRERIGSRLTSISIDLPKN
jgi:hypothetical protein